MESAEFHGGRHKLMTEFTLDILDAGNLFKMSRVQFADGPFGAYTLRRFRSRKVSAY